MLLNADVGEGVATDALLMPFLDQASIACGGHTGDQQSMQQAVLACIENNVIIGAHPSYPDKQNFGRSAFNISSSELRQSLQQQIQSITAVCDSLGVTLCYVKPHGALYNEMMVQANLFDLVLEVVADQANDLDLMLAAVLPKDYINKAKRVGIGLIREAFADRQYLSNGQLAPRKLKGAVFDQVEQVCRQVADLNSGLVKDQLGNSITLQAESICIHADNPASVKSIQKLAEIINA